MREGVGQRVVEGQVVPGEVAHGDEPVVGPVVGATMWFTKASIAPPFQLWCWGPHEWVMSFVVWPSSSGGSLTRWNGWR